MVAAVIELYIEQGTDWSKIVKFYTDTAKTQPVDFSGCTGRCKIRNLDGAVIAEPDVTFPEAGSIMLALTNIETSGMVTDGITYDATTPGTYDVEVVAADSTVKRWLNGPVTISPEVTK